MNLQVMFINIHVVKNALLATYVLHFFWKFAVACKNIFETIKYKEMRFDISIVYQGYYFIGHKAVSSNGKSMKFESCFKF